MNCQGEPGSRRELTCTVPAVYDEPRLATDYLYPAAAVRECCRGSMEPSEVVQLMIV